MIGSTDESQISDALTPWKHSLFWMKLVLGIIFGASSYFILRFVRFIPFYILAPILYFLTCLLILEYLDSKLGNIKIELKPRIKFILNYTETWIIAYFLLGTAMFYFGW